MANNCESLGPALEEVDHLSAEYLCEILESLPNTSQRNAMDSTSSEENGEQPANLPTSELRRILTIVESPNYSFGETVENESKEYDKISTTDDLLKLRCKQAGFFEDLSKSKENGHEDNIEQQNSNGETQFPDINSNESNTSGDVIPHEMSRFRSLTTLTGSLTGSLSTHASNDASPNEIPAPRSTLPEERIIMSPSNTFSDVELSYFEFLVSEYIEADLSKSATCSPQMVKENFRFPATSDAAHIHAFSVSEMENGAGSNLSPYLSFETNTENSNKLSVKTQHFETESKVEQSDGSLVREESSSLNYTINLVDPSESSTTYSANAIDSRESSTNYCANAIDPSESNTTSICSEIINKYHDSLDHISDQCLSMDIKNTIYSHIKQPFWKQADDGDSVYKADTPTITALCGEDDGTVAEINGEAIQILRDSDKLPDTKLKTKLESELSRNVQDEMLNIIRELRRLSADDDTVCDLKCDKETPDLIHPLSKSQWNSNRITRNISFKTEGCAQHCKSDHFDELSPISEVSGDSKNNSHSTPEELENTNTPEPLSVPKLSPEPMSVSKLASKPISVPKLAPEPMSVFLIWRNASLDQIKTNATNFDPKYLTTDTHAASRLDECTPINNYKTQGQKVLPQESNQSARSEIPDKQIDIGSIFKMNKIFAKPHLISSSENSRLKRVSFNLDEPVSELESIQLSNQLGGYHDTLRLENFPDIDSSDTLPGLRKALSLNKDGSNTSLKASRKLKMASRSKSLPEEFLFLDGNDKSRDLTLFNQAGINIIDLNFTEGQGQQPPHSTGEGTTNFSFIKDNPHSDQGSQRRVYKARFDVDEENSDYDNDDDISGLAKQAEDKQPKLTVAERRHLILRRQQSSSVVPGKDHLRGKITKAWSSLDSRVTESTPLAKSFSKTSPKATDNTDTPQDHGDFPPQTELDQEISGNWPDMNISEDGQTLAEEDTLSLEFFVPGKKQYIRLHRRTFIRFVLKYLIFFFTFLVWVGSVSAIGFGTWMLMSNGAIIDDVTDVFLDPYVLLCVVGGIIFLVTFFGCVGALRENICLLKLFHISLTTVLVLEGLLGTLVFLFYTMPEFRQAVKVGPEEILKKAVKQYFDDDGMKNWIDTVQREFQCCGVSMSNKGYLDWQDNIYFNCSDSNPSVHRCSVPISCCIFEPGDHINFWCGVGIMKETDSHILHIINTKGCMKSFGEWLGKNDAMVGYVAMGVIVPQVIGVVAARCFVKHIQKRSVSKQLSDPVKFVSGL